MIWWLNLSTISVSSRCESVKMPSPNLPDTGRKSALYRFFFRRYILLWAASNSSNLRRGKIDMISITITRDRIILIVFQSASFTPLIWNISRSSTGPKQEGTKSTQNCAIPKICPASGNSQAEFKSLYLPAMYRGICCSSRVATKV